MIWVLLLSLGAEPLDDVAPLRVGPARAVMSARTTQTLPGTDCTFERREVADPLVAWQWVARCAGQDVSSASVGAQVGVRLFTQQGRATVFVFDADHAVDLQEASAAPTWVSRPLLANLQKPSREPSSVLARDARDGSLAVHEWNRGYERVTPSTAPTGPTRTPLFERAPPPDTPVRSMWFSGAAREPWVFYADDPWRRVEFSLRAPGGETRQLFTRPARTTGGNYRVEALTHVTADSGEVFSVMVDHRHLVLWPRSDGSFLPRVAGDAVLGQTPVLAQRSAPPCVERTESRREESVNAPRLFLRGKQPWALWLTGTSDTRWHVGPVLNFDAKDERSCEWILDGQEGHVAVTLGRFTAEGQLEEQLRLPLAGAPDHLELVSSERGVTLVVVANGEITVTHLKL